MEAVADHLGFLHLEGGRLFSGGDCEGLGEDIRFSVLDYADLEFVFGVLFQAVDRVVPAALKAVDPRPFAARGVLRVREPLQQDIVHLFAHKGPFEIDAVPAQRLALIRQELGSTAVAFDYHTIAGQGDFIPADRGNAEAGIAFSLRIGVAEHGAVLIQKRRPVPLAPAGFPEIFRRLVIEDVVCRKDHSLAV